MMYIYYISTWLFIELKIFSETNQNSFSCWILGVICDFKVTITPNFNKKLITLS